MGLGSRCIGARSADPVSCPVQGTLPHHGFACFSNGRHVADASRSRSGVIFWRAIALRWLDRARSLDRWRCADRIVEQGSSGTAHASIFGDSLVVLSMFAAIAWILISKRLMQTHSPMMVT